MKTGNGFFWMIADGGSIENEIFWKGLDKGLEPETIWIWKLLSKESKTIVDIGANTGIYSLLAKNLNPGCDVYCFEPSRSTFKELIKNIECNYFDIQAFEMAVSDSNSEKIFYDLFKKNQTSASLSPEKMKDNPDFDGPINEYLVKTTTLDEFIKAKEINIVDLIKIDVELHEPEVFAGLIGVLEKHKPIVIFEVLISNVAEKLNSFFRQKDYCLFHLEPDFIAGYCLRKVDKLVGLVNYDWNYLACPADKMWLLKNIGVL
ncbi:MAG: FkbM family methyltransferase [Bacteroidales bacterium]